MQVASLKILPPLTRLAGTLNSINDPKYCQAFIDAGICKTLLYHIQNPLLTKEILWSLTNLLTDKIVYEALINHPNFFEKLLRILKSKEFD